MKVALVTGAASGIGRATRAPVRRGRIWRRRADRNGAGLAETLADVEHGVAVQGDVSVWDDAERMVEAARERFGRLDAVACIAGIEIDHPVDQLAIEDWDAVVDTSLKGTYLVCRAAVPLLRDSGGGAIVTTGSVLGRVAMPGVTAYGAAKAGMEGTDARDGNRLRARGNPRQLHSPRPHRHAAGVGVRAAGGPREGPHLAASEVPLGRMAEPAEIGRVIVFLCSDGASFITGTSLAVDGGALARGSMNH